MQLISGTDLHFAILIIGKGALQKRLGRIQTKSASAQKYRTIAISRPQTREKVGILRFVTLMLLILILVPISSSLALIMKATDPDSRQKTAYRE